jgi:hypothetical protein
MDMIKLNLPNANLKIKLVKGTMQVFDQVRKKYVKLTPEEWVRQNFIYYLNSYKGYPLGLMQLEKIINYNGMSKRADIVLNSSEGAAKIIVECKAPNIAISQSAFDQISRYNYNIHVDYLIVTNGIKHFCCKVNYEENNYSFVKEIPNY